ncbi:hypothetical protein RND81_02G009700 [Saponaria officinalis]|uniref:Uncharacterized protein n=1 Tax=Saponaria officinalis TaxID=3572 RepID=A0AAW1MSG0_SAPOF
MIFYDQQLNTMQITCTIILIFPIIYKLIKIIFNFKKPRKVYLVNHASFKPKNCQQITKQKTISMIKPLGPNFTYEQWRSQEILLGGGEIFRGANYKSYKVI